MVVAKDNLADIDHVYAKLPYLNTESHARCVSVMGPALECVPILSE